MRVLSMCSRSHSWDACRLSWSDWVSRADTFSWRTRSQERFKVFFFNADVKLNQKKKCNLRMKAKLSYLSLSHTTVILGALLEKLLTHGFPLLLQAALPLQLLELQVFEFFGFGFQCLAILINEGAKKCIIVTCSL